MLEKVEEIKQQIIDADASTKDELEQFRLTYISKKGALTSLFEAFKSVPNEEKPLFGKKLNEVKNLAMEKFRELSSSLENNQASRSSAPVDLTLPPVRDRLGSIHPLNSARAKIIQIFERMGFNVEHGPEIEDDWHNFTALNFPENHPAREMQDTFFIEKDPEMLLRTHTSNVQIRLMEHTKPPLRSIMPGRVFRNEAISARAHCIFHQVEGLYVDENVSFADLKATLLHFAKEMFGKDTKTRYRPSFFPFTEPSAEIDISCNICKGKGCNICKYISGLLDRLLGLP